jgi:predicted CXXCH cytochrome family protein
MAMEKGAHMKAGRLAKVALTVLLAAGLAGCGRGPNNNAKEILSKPKTYVGSEQCKMCHLEHFDSWRATLHSRSIQDVSQNLDALAAEIDPEIIRADLERMKDKLKVPLDEIYIPKVEEIKYTIGVQWKQGFLIKKNGTLAIAPIEYDIWADRWIASHENDWDKHSWTRDCAGCHVVGVDLEKDTFIEGRVGCEACHGPGSHHVVLPKTAVFKKRLAIVNPATLPAGLRTQVCGSCHSRGTSTRVKGVSWPVGFQPGRALGPYYKCDSYDGGDIKSVHARQGVTCTSCHYVHQLGVAPTQFQTKESGSQQCMTCHRVINKNLSHSIHSFANCIGCHMPRVVKSSESGDIHSHVFMALMPKDTLKNPAIPNSCQICHKHKDADLATLQQVFDGLAKKTLVGVHRSR